jgi:cell division protein FtsW
MPAATRGAQPRARRRGKARAGLSDRAARQPLEHRILLTATLCLMAFGAVMVYSASSATTLLQGRGTGSGYLIRYLLFGGIGLALMNLLARRGLASIQPLIGMLLAVSFVLVAAVHIPHVGVSINGARRWIGPGVFQFQPSELLKFSLVLYAATLLARRPSRVRDLRELSRPLLIVVGVACLLVATQPDLGTAIVIALTICTLLVAAGIPMGKLGLLIGSAFVMVIFYALIRPYARARLTSFIDPWAHAGGSGFQAVQGQIAIGSGGLFGVGPGQSVQKAFYLPEAQTDFILAVIGEELGMMGVSALLFLYGLIAYAGLRAAKRARDLHSSLLAVGMTALILTQALLNMFAVLGLAPLTGVPLPFVSYGSSSLIVMLAAMGLLLHVAAGESTHLRAVGRPRTSSRPRVAEREEIRASRGPGLAGRAAQKQARWSNGEAGQENRDRRRGDSWARRSSARGGRRAAG